jgi:hypothetical protein
MLYETCVFSSPDFIYRNSLKQIFKDLIAMIINNCALYLVKEHSAMLWMSYQ